MEPGVDVVQHGEDVWNDVMSSGDSEDVGDSADESSHAFLLPFFRPPASLLLQQKFHVGPGEFSSPASTRRPTSSCPKLAETQHPNTSSTMAAEGTTAAAATAGEGGKALHELYPANAYMELTLSAESGGEKVSGIFHCTDEISNTVVLRSSLVYTTLSSQIRFVGAATIAESKVIRKAGEEGGGRGRGRSYRRRH